MKLVWDDHRVLIGASAVGNQTKELISHLALMVHLRVSIDELSTHFSAHPPVSELALHAIHSICDGR